MRVAARRRPVQARYMALLLALAATAAAYTLYHHSTRASNGYSVDEIQVDAGYANGYCILASKSLHCSLYIIADRVFLVKAINIRLNDSSIDITVPWGGIYVQREVAIALDARRHQGDAEGLIVVMPSPWTTLELAFNASTLLDTAEELSSPRPISTYTIHIPSGTVSSIELSGVVPSTDTAYYLTVSPLDPKPHGMLHAKLFIGQETVTWERVVNGPINGFTVPLGGMVAANATTAYSRLIVAYSSWGRVDMAKFIVRLYSSEPLVLGLILNDGSMVRVSIPIISLGG